MIFKTKTGSVRLSTRTRPVFLFCHLIFIIFNNYRGCVGPGILATALWWGWTRCVTYLYQPAMPILTNNMDDTKTIELFQAEVNYFLTGCNQRYATGSTFAQSNMPIFDPFILLSWKKCCQHIATIFISQNKLVHQAMPNPNLRPGSVWCTPHQLGVDLKIILSLPINCATEFTYLSRTHGALTALAL